MSATRSVLGTRRRELGDRRHHVDVRQILQRSHLVLSQRALAADVQNRALGAECGGNAGHRVGAAGTGGGDHAAELAGLARVAVGGVRRDLLVAHVDDADALIDAAIVDVDDVAAAQGEDRVDALVLQRLGDQMAAGDDARVAALALQGVFGGRGLGLRIDAGFTVAMLPPNSEIRRRPRCRAAGRRSHERCGPRPRHGRSLRGLGEVPRPHGLQHEQREQRRDHVECHE